MGTAARNHLILKISQKLHAELGHEQKHGEMDASHVLVAVPSSVVKTTVTSSDNCPSRRDTTTETEPPFSGTVYSVSSNPITAAGDTHNHTMHNSTRDKVENFPTTIEIHWPCSELYSSLIFKSKKYITIMVKLQNKGHACILFEFQGWSTSLAAIMNSNC